LSRTLIPTLVMWFYQNVHHTGHADEHEGPARGWKRPFVTIHQSFERGFARFRTGFRNLLGVVLHHRKAFCGVFLLFCVATALLIPLLGEDFFPSVDAGQFRLHLRARSGTRIEESARLTDAVEQVIRHEIPEDELAGILDNIGIPNSGISLSYSNNGVIG